MSRTFMILLLAASCLLFFGCNDSPEKVVSEFSKALKKKDYQAAAACVHNGDAERISRNSGVKALKNLKPVSADIDGNEAEVTVEVTRIEKIQVKKVNGKWLLKD